MKRELLIGFLVAVLFSVTSPIFAGTHLTDSNVDGTTIEVSGGDLQLKNTGHAVDGGKHSAATDITDFDVSITAHGFAPKAPNDATKYLDGTGAYNVPPGGCAIWTPIGTGDDMETIIEAGSPGDLFWLEAGSHTVANPITIPTRVTVAGSRGVDVTFTLTAAEYAWVIGSSSSSVRVEGFLTICDGGGGVSIGTDSNNIYFTDMRFSMDNTGTATLACVKQDVSLLQDIRFTNCQFAGDVDAASSITDVGTGGQGVYFTGCYFAGDGVGLDIAGSDQLTFQGCYFDNCPVDTASTTNYVDFLGCYFYCTGTNVVVIGGYGIMNSCHVYGDGNSTTAVTVRDSASCTNNQVYSESEGIFVRDGDGHKVVGNTVVVNGASFTAIHVHAEGLCSSNTLIVGPSVTQNNAGLINIESGEWTVIGNYLHGEDIPVAITNGYGIIQGAATFTTITGNHINAEGTYGFEHGIELNGTNGSICVGNYIKNVKSAGAEGIWVKSDRHIVTGNHVYDVSDGDGIYLDAGADFNVISDNVVCVTGAGDGGITTAGLVDSNVFEGNIVDATGLTAFDIDATSTNCVIKNNIPVGAVTFPVNGIDNNIVHDNGLVEELTVDKTSDESIASSVAIQDDDDLFFNLPAGEVWHFRFWLRVSNAGVLGDFTCSVNATTNAEQWLECHIYSYNEDASDIKDGGIITASETEVGFDYVGTGPDTVVIVEGTVLGNAGADAKFVLRWAQRVSNATATVVKAGSHVEAHKHE